MTGRTNAERWRAAAAKLCAALPALWLPALCAIAFWALVVPAAYGQRGGGHNAAPHMSRPMAAQRSMPRYEPPRQQQRQFERQQQRDMGWRAQRPAQGYGRQEYEGRRGYGRQGYRQPQPNYARPYGQAGGQAGGQTAVPRPALNGATPRGAARPEYQRPGYAGANSGARTGAGNVRPALPGNGRQYAFPPGHLGSWMNQHRNLSGQEQLLRNDPSFNRLPQADQQRLMHQLQQVNQLPPGERERRLERAEKIEHMTSQERGQLAQSTRQLRALPPDRQTRVSQAFRDLRGVPVDQRQTVLDSEHYQSQFSPEERGILTNLLRAEPYEPPAH